MCVGSRTLNHGDVWVFVYLLLSEHYSAAKSEYFKTFLSTEKKELWLANGKTEREDSKFQTTYISCKLL